MIWHNIWQQSSQRPLRKTHTSLVLTAAPQPSLQMLLFRQASNLQVISIMQLASGSLLIASSAWVAYGCSENSLGGLVTLMSRKEHFQSSEVILAACANIRS